MNKHEKQRPHRGFTLIELLAVVAIIAILAALLFPGLSAATAKAKSVNCRNNLRQWATAVLLYAQENDGRLPAATTDSSSGYTSRSLSWYDYGTRVLGYSTNMLVCKAAGPKNLNLFGAAPATSESNGLWPITNGVLGIDKYGYTCNSYWMERDDHWQPDFRGFRLGMVPSLSKALMFGDGDGSAYNGGDPTWNFRYRHEAGSAFINVALFDGRVDAWNIEDCRKSGDKFLDGAPVGCPGECTNAPLYKVDKRFMPPYS